MGVQLHLKLLPIVALFSAVQHASSQSRVTSHFVQGNLGTIPNSNSLLPEDIKDSALATLKSFLVSDFGALSSDENSEVVQAPSDEKVYIDDKGDLHIRYHHLFDGLIVEGAAMMVHINGNNRQVYAINGEYAEPVSFQDMSVAMDCEMAVNEALKELNINDGMYLSECTLTAVYADDGFFHKAWKALIGYTESDGSDQSSFVFASLATGAPLALHPQNHGARSLLTVDCRDTESCTKVVSRSSGKIDIPNKSVTDAHNHAVDTYNFYFDNFGRDSLDDKGMTIVSNVDFGKDYINAYFDGYQVYYGSGDASKGYYPLSRGLDVAAHELSHGVTFYSSGLIYSKDSGALNEAMSDVMAASIERIEGKKSNIDTWLIGEDIFKNGGAIRNMADPAEYGHYDYYPTRYTGSDDNGGVHWNSGIMNLAFQLLVEGGTHPRGKTSVEVPPIDSDFDTSILEASRIFYNANVACLTPGSNFISVRKCTLMHANDYYDNVAAAWTAVGVPDQSPGSKAFAPKQCLNLVKKDCNCALFNKSKSTCWKQTTVEKCYPRLSEKANKGKFQKGVLSAWKRYCKIK